MLKTDPLGLRNNIDFYRKQVDASTEDLSKIAFRALSYCMFANQIIENHKIVNYRECSTSWKMFKRASTNEEVLDIFNTLWDIPYARLKEHTDGLVYQSKLKKIIQNE